MKHYIEDSLFVACNCLLIIYQNRQDQQRKHINKKVITTNIETSTLTAYQEIVP